MTVTDKQMELKMELKMELVQLLSNISSVEDVCIQIEVATENTKIAFERTKHPGLSFEERLERVRLHRQAVRTLRGLLIMEDEIKRAVSLNLDPVTLIELT